MTEKEPPSGVRFLLPVERLLARQFADSRRHSNTPKARRLAQNYGPEGLVLLGAAYADAFAGGVIGLFGVVLLFCSQAYSPLEPYGYYLLGLGVIVDVVGTGLRWIQCTRAGRQFRGGLPPVARS